MSGPETALRWLGGGGWSNEAAYWMKQNYIDTLKRIQEAKKEAINKTRAATAEVKKNKIKLKKPVDTN